MLYLELMFLLLASFYLPCCNLKALQDAVQEELLLAQRQAEQERAAAQAQQQVRTLHIGTTHHDVLPPEGTTAVCFPCRRVKSRTNLGDRS